MENEFYQVSLKAIIRRPDGRVLCLKGKKGGSFEGYHDLPGGRINKEEFEVSFMDILKREVAEEIGPLAIDISPTPCALGRHWSTDGFPVLYLFFLATCGDEVGDLPTSDEHEGMEWLDLTAEKSETLFVSGIREGMQEFQRQSNI